MALKDRIGGTVPFTCENSSFVTDIHHGKGKPHGKGNAKGSVFETPLVDNGMSLWLEYVKDLKGGPDVFWLMWYEADGTPKMPMSGVITADQLKNMVSQLRDYVKLG